MAATAGPFAEKNHLEHLLQEILPELAMSEERGDQGSEPWDVWEGDAFQAIARALFLDYDIGLTCLNCGAIRDTLEPVFGSRLCKERYERHQRYADWREGHLSR
jgi:hypothetical protein